MLDNRQHRDTNNVNLMTAPDNCLKAVSHSEAWAEMGVQGR